MQKDPNKVLEVLLRRADGGGSPLPAQPHLDADIVAAFAAGAMPEAFRNDCISHLADCARCRVMLSAAMTFEAVEAPVPAPARLVSDMPWWKTAFRAPVYTYAGLLLVLVFSGMIGIVLFRGGDGSVEVSRVEESVPSQSATAPLTVPSSASDEREAASVDKTKSEAVQEGASKSTKIPILRDSWAAPPPPTVPSAAVAPTVRETATEDGAVEQRPAAKMAAPPAPVPMKVEAELNAMGKRFTKRDGLWVDTEYRGGSVTSVKRGTAEFETLDQVLRSIANEVPGPLLIVWQGKAYRIQ